MTRTKQSTLITKSKRRPYLAALVLPLFCLAQDNGPGSVVKRVEPEYDAALSKAYLVNHIAVEMIVDQDGVPFSLNTEPKGPSPRFSRALEDNVVNALAKWRFRPEKKNGVNVPFAVTLTVPLRTAASANLQQAFLERWRPYPKESADAIKTADALDQAGALRLAQRVDNDPNAVEARAAMLVYLAKQGGEDQDEIRKARARHLTWMIQNQPDLDILGSPFALVNSIAGPLADTTGYGQLRQLWIEQLAHSPVDELTLEHAINFLSVADPEKSEQALLPLLPKMNIAGELIGNVYGFAAVGVTGIDPVKGTAVAALDRVPDTAFARRSRSSLAASTDLRVVFSGLATVIGAGKSLAAAHHLPDGFDGVCQQLLTHAKTLLPETSASCDLNAPGSEATKPVEGVPTRIRIGGNLQAKSLIKKVTPSYPSEARSRGIQGTVRFLAVIDKSGKMKTVSLVSGPLALYESARNAVLQWVYKATLLNGLPVEVVTQIDVYYKLDAR